MSDGTFGPLHVFSVGDARVMSSSAMDARTAPHRTGATATIVGIVLLVLGVLAAGGGGAVLLSATIANGIGQFRDADGFLPAGSIDLSTETYALSSPAAHPLVLGGDAPALPFDLASFRVTVTSADGPVFVGIAAQRDIDSYLQGVGHSEVEGMNRPSSSVEYRDVPGAAPSVPPGELDIWASSASGSGPQEIQFSLTPGEWGMIVMNADGSRGVDVQMDVAARSGLIAPAVGFLTVLGWAILLVGVGGVIAGAVLLGVGQSGLRSSREGQVDRV